MKSRSPEVAIAILLQTEIALVFRDPIQQTCTPPAMGCGTSKLKGDSFDSINSSTYPPPPRDKDEIERSQEPKPLIYDADIPKTAKEASAAKKKKSCTPLRQSFKKDKLASSNITSIPQNNPAAHSSSSDTYVSRKEARHNSSNKLSTLRQQWKDRSGVPEPRDPITGRGLHTGLTPEEIKTCGEHERRRAVRVW